MQINLLEKQKREP